MEPHDWVVFKFGGASLATVKCIQDIKTWISSVTQCRTAIVVSAMGGVTDLLQQSLNLAQSQNDHYRQILASIRDLHIQVVTDFSFSPSVHQMLEDNITQNCDDIENLLQATYLSQSYSPQVLELVLGFGELWSAQILTAVLREIEPRTEYLDAREVLVVSDSETGPIVHWETSQNRLNQWLDQRSPHFLVITGFIASTEKGIPTTLKRNGSDFSAAIFGVLLKAKEIIIWKNVDGVLSADPRRVPDALVLSEMSYHEASELAYFGAKVIHPKTLGPAILHQIPIRIRNSFNLSAPGTLIHQKSQSQGAVKGFSTIEKVALINVEGTGMLGVPGVASRLFGSLRNLGISVIMISQASSEHSICFVVPEEQAEAAAQAIEQEFYAEKVQGLVQTVEIQKDCCVLAAVGDNMAYQPGTAGKFFAALGEAGVNVRAIAQGSSERNTSVVIRQSDATRGLQAVHSAFYLSRQTVSVGLIGPGLIGATLLQQMAQQNDLLHDRLGVDFRVRAIANSKKMLLSQKAIPLTQWTELFEQLSEPFDMEKFLKHVRSDSIPHSVIVDCTASSMVSENYPDILSRGIHIVTPNKKANSGSFELYQHIRNALKESRVHYLYEATVGAGLPLVNTLRELVQTGDEVIEIEGIFSGTLAYLFNTFDGASPFSRLVAEAREKGFTEPDPRDDLSGMDVARKLVILAREAQLNLNIEDVEIENLIPKPLQGIDVDQFLSRLHEYDEPFAKRLRLAKDQGQVLRYVGYFSRQNGAKVSLKAIPASHSFARITGTDNIIAFRTKRYQQQPLIVQGPGAGPEVTAGGVFADLLRLANYLGAPSQ